jgi:pyrrolidone-carboxylate peptidase
VYWDLAGAILIHEMENFRPDMVIMTGRGGTDWTGTFEAGAINHARDLAGYESDGRIAERNLPATMDAKIIASQDFESAIAMTWDRQKLADVTGPIANTFGFFVASAPAASYSNTYICNNISYVVLNALRGESFYLAGDLIAVNPSSANLRSDQTQIRYQGSPTIPAGFFHYPHNANNSSTAVFGWSRILATAIHSSLK